ncbi:type II toxin-antitoxin system VapC family toxin [Mucilaginibacter sp.]|uniref:type II toxin-antitoxin system VapC family toxin n=1 Tax=Mucilaginibacter sp. TaxID=1882438 RepID=UPI003265BA3C
MANKYLLDTHALIWFQEGSSRIPYAASAIIQNPDNEILFSQISIFELAIKQRIGKLSFLVPLEDVYAQALADGFSYVNIQNNHIFQYNQIELFDNHRDPFDRLLIATAIEENAIIISGDDKFKLYENQVKTVW